MSVRYVPWADSTGQEVISEQWAVALRDAHDDGVDTHVNEGHRTKDRQRQLIREQGIYNAVTNPHGAAPVSDNAPHIRTGRFDHAIDFRDAAAVARWLRAHGIRCAFTVATESWHLEANAADLQAYFVAHRDPLVGYTASEKRWIREYDQLKRSGKDRARRGVLRERMTTRRRAIWRLAQTKHKGGDGHGWTASRIRRYHSLTARTS